MAVGHGTAVQDSDWAREQCECGSNIITSAGQHIGTDNADEGIELCGHIDCCEQHLFHKPPKDRSNKCDGGGIECGGIGWDGTGAGWRQRWRGVSMAIIFGCVEQGWDWILGRSERCCNTDQWAIHIDQVSKLWRSASQGDIGCALQLGHNRRSNGDGDGTERWDQRRDCDRAGWRKRL
jgi:hypothetical protein